MMFFQIKNNKKCSKKNSPYCDQHRSKTEVKLQSANYLATGFSPAAALALALCDFFAL